MGLHFFFSFDLTSDLPEFASLCFALFASLSLLPLGLKCLLMGFDWNRLRVMEVLPCSLKHLDLNSLKTKTSSFVSAVGWPKHRIEYEYNTII